MVSKHLLVSGSALAAALSCWSGAALAQTTTTLPATTTASEVRNDDILVTGSRIKRDPTDSSLPLQVITPDELAREGISSPEQMIQYLSSNGNGADNLASNSDVVTGAQRGTNGLSAANLRGQGSGATLVLLNGRRIAAHGLSGSAVDVNQIPFAAIERVEILKDGASAIYGTDAVGGVINYITRTDYQGVGVEGFTDITEGGGGEIYRLSGIAGYGDLDEQGFNVMAAVSYRWNSALRGDQRDFVNGNQPSRGLSIDTRGTPLATAFPLNPSTLYFPGGTLLGGTTGGTVLASLLIPGTTVRATGGINPLDLPGGAGCDSMDGGMAYDETLWNAANAAYACAWDTGRAAMLQQPIQTLTYYGRATLRIAQEHELYVEVTGSDADSSKRFSNAQISGNTSNLPVAYPLNALTAATYNQVYNAILGTFPGIAANYGKPIAYRWRCVECGVREYNTNTQTFRAAAGIDGPLGGGWDYRAGASYARSESSSLLGSGYYYRGTLANGAADPTAPIAPGATLPGLAGLLNAGIINPFSLTQTQAAIDGLAAVSAEGTTLYGGQYEVKQFDASVSGGLFDIWGGTVQVAAGIDYRRETYEFNGSAAAAATAPVIFLAAFDNVNALTAKNRTVRAAYAEILFPILDNLEITAAARIDDYTGFGSTTNPKVSFKYRPINALMFRGSYNTGFRVPAFNQIFNGITETPSSAGANLVDPFKCPSLLFSATDPNCANITPADRTGGNLILGPEKAEQFSLGFVFQPADRFSFSVDWWSIKVEDTIQILTTTQLLQNAALFPDRFIRDSSGAITVIDRTWLNAGARDTQGLEFSARGGFDLGGGALTLGMEGTYLLRKREKLTPTAAWGPSQIGIYTTAGDLGLRWKHSAFVTWTDETWTLSLSQIFRNGYANQVLPGIANGTVTRPDFNYRVENYITYNMSIGMRVNEDFTMTLGVRNLFNTDPPFAITYDSNTGSGSSWEPRVADPRGRSFTFQVKADF
jgi:iron complex outermembrane receptor protein